MSDFMYNHYGLFVETIEKELDKHPEIWYWWYECGGIPEFIIAVKDKKPIYLYCVDTGTYAHYDNFNPDQAEAANKFMKVILENLENAEPWE